MILLIFDILGVLGASGNLFFQIQINSWSVWLFLPSSVQLEILTDITMKWCYLHSF